MGIRLDAEREGPPWPVPTYIELLCDGTGHGLFVRGPVRFACDPWAGTALTNASAMGWKETYDKHGKKLWLGPCCSGKVK